MARLNRILLVTSSFPKLSETFIVNKFLGLLEKGWDVHILCHNSKSEEWETFPQISRNEHKGRVHVALKTTARITGAARVFGRMLAKPLSASTQYKTLRPFPVRKRMEMTYLDSALYGLRPDLVHFEFASLALNRIYLKQWLNCKLTCSFRGYDLNFAGLENPTYYERLWEHLDAVHCLGKDLWRRALARGCPESMPHVLIPPAIDTELFKPTGIRERSTAALRLLSVGRLEWKKGYEHALEAICLLKQRGVSCKLRIVGDGPALESIAFARHQLQLDAEVEFLGALKQSAVRDEMSQSDVFVHSAVSEGFCNAVLEAQAMELPVVSTDADGLRENVQDGETGYVVPRRDPPAMAAKLEVLAEDPDLRQKMGEAGRTRVLSRFQLEQQARSWDTFYQNVIGGHFSELARERIRVTHGD